jgi:hypothetical protein
LGTKILNSMLRMSLFLASDLATKTAYITRRAELPGFGFVVEFVYP